MNSLDFRLLGPMQVSKDGAGLPLPNAAERALLALLVLSPGRSIPGSALVDRLWSDHDLPVDPVNALQTRVSKLRRALSAADVHIIVRDSVGYRADVAPDSVDVHRFVDGVRAARAAVGADDPVVALARYDAALDLWRGEPLADFATQPWASVEAARLLQLRLAVLTERGRQPSAIRRRRYVLRHFADVLMLALPVLRPLRLLRLVVLLQMLNRRATSALRGRVALYVGGSAVLLFFSAGSGQQPPTPRAARSPRSRLTSQVRDVRSLR